MSRKHFLSCGQTQSLRLLAPCVREAIPLHEWQIFTPETSCRLINTVANVSRSNHVNDQLQLSARAALQRHYLKSSRSVLRQLGTSHQFEMSRRLSLDVGTRAFPNSTPPAGETPSYPRFCPEAILTPKICGVRMWRLGLQTDL